MNNYRYQFKHFDPKYGVLPEPFAIMFVEINHRARKILNDFSCDEISETISALNKIIRDKSFVDPLWEDLKKEPIKTPVNGQILELLPSANDIEAIYQNIENITLSQYIKINNIGWQHIFACLALFYSELVSEYLFTKKGWTESSLYPKPNDESFIRSYLTDFLTEAKQAITTAELLAKQKSIQRKMLSDQTSEAAKNRFSKTSDPLKQAVITCYTEKYQSRTNRDAASRIFKDLHNSGRLTFDIDLKRSYFDGNLALSNDDPEHQFAKWIGTFKKQRI